MASKMRPKYRFTPANTVDILRMEQRDREFIDFFQDQLSQFLKLFFKNNYHNVAKNSRAITNTLYYFFTSCKNLQTIGEEYAGIIRVCNSNSKATFLIQLTWLILAVYGEPIYIKLLCLLENYVNTIDDLHPEIRAGLIKFINFLKVYKDKILMIHQALFFKGSVFYNVSNRLLGLRYVLIRPWLQDDSSLKSFKLLGTLSIIYLLIYLSKEYLHFSKTEDVKLESADKSSNKICVLCTESCKDVSATPCGHLFCWTCIYDSLKYSSKCPTCREDIKPSRIMCLKNF